jgi:hypothetical protein
MIQARLLLRHETDPAGALSDVRPAMNFEILDENV